LIYIKKTYWKPGIVEGEIGKEPGLGINIKKLLTLIKGLVKNKLW